jgi:hypothetical protein
MEALCPAAMPMNDKPLDDNFNDPCNLVPPSETAKDSDKANEVTPLSSPTGVDQQPPSKNSIATTSKKIDSPQTRVRISDATEVVENNPSPTATTTSGRSILQSTANIMSQSLNSSVSDDDASQSKTHLKEMHDHSNLLYKKYSDNGMKEWSYHVTSFAGLYPIWPIIEFSMAPTREMKDDHMTSFSKCVVALLAEILYVNDTTKIATVSITDDESKYIGSKADLPNNFTKLRQYIMISGGSWVFNKKAKSSNDVYARFRLKSQVNTNEIVNRVSFKFSRLGGKNLKKKQHQAMEMETPLILLFVSNRTDQASIISDTRQMLDMALDDIKQHGMLPEEFEDRDISHFTLCFNVPHLPAETKSFSNKSFDHYKEHSKKAFHFEVAKEEINYFKYLSAHVHRMKLDTKYFGKFAKFTATLGNNAPLSDCTRLR